MLTVEERAELLRRIEERDADVRLFNARVLAFGFDEAVRLGRLDALQRERGEAA
jgi:hypothetical protein